MYSKKLLRCLCLICIVMIGTASTIIQAAELEYIGSLGGKIRDGVACQGYVFLAQGKSIIILDSKEPRRLREISRFRVDGDTVDALAVKWPILFYTKKSIGNSFHEVSTLEIKDPAHPREITVSEDLGGVDLATSVSLLLVNMRSRLQIYDVSDPYHPHAIPPKTAYEKWEWGTDISMINKLKPPLTIPGEVLYSGSIRGLLAEGQRVYILDESADLKTFDLTDPLKPRRSQSIMNADQIKSRIESEIKAFNNDDKTYRAHFRIIRENLPNNGSCVDQITIQDIANKNAPKRLSSFAKMEDSRETIEKFGIIGDRLFVVHSGARIYDRYSIIVYDIKNPEKPIFMGKVYDILWELPGNVAISGDRIYLADHDRGLIILRFMKPVRSPQSPQG